jgi:hypothetical protein
MMKIEQRIRSRKQDHTLFSVVGIGSTPLPVADIDKTSYCPTEKKTLCSLSLKLSFLCEAGRGVPFLASEGG